MSEEKSNVCSGGPTLVFACSGAADVGEISDRAARKLSKDGVGAMYCLENAGFKEFEYIRVTDLGLEKGKSPAIEENINKVTSKAIEVLS